MKRPGDNDPIHATSLSDSALDDTTHFADTAAAARSAVRSSKDQQGQQKKGYLLTLMSAFIDKNPSPDAPSPKIDNVLAAQSGKGDDSHLSEETPSLLRRLWFLSSTSSSDQEADSNPASRNVSPRGNRRSTATGVSATPILKKVDAEKFSDVADSFTSSNTMSADQTHASGDHATDLLKEDITASDDKNSIGFASMVS
jgi:hypothetical protein